MRCNASGNDAGHRSKSRWVSTASGASAEPSVARDVGFGVVLERAGSKTGTRRPGLYPPCGSRNQVECIRLGEIEWRGVMRNVKRTIRAPAKDAISNLAPLPQWIESKLCKLVTRIPAGENWAHEIKFDGFRMHARIQRPGRAADAQRPRLDGQVTEHRRRDRRAQLLAGLCRRRTLRRAAGRHDVIFRVARPRGYAGGAGLFRVRPVASRRRGFDAAAAARTKGASRNVAERCAGPLVLSRVHWVRPELVAEVTYLTWTADGLLASRRL
jgi:hypothetical protein